MLEILERLDSVTMTIETLKATRIGVAVNKLVKRNDLPPTVHMAALELVNRWKQIATATVREQQQYQPHSQYRQAPPPEPEEKQQPSSVSNKKRSRSAMLDEDEMPNQDMDDHCNTNNSNNSNNYNNKRQRVNQNNSNSNSSMFTFGGKKSVPKLTQICIKVMKQNAMKLGKIPCELDGELVKQIYGSLKPSELKQIYKLNAHFRPHLDILWRRQLLNLNPNFVKTDDNMTWFKAYQLYLLERRDKLESAKRKLAMKTEEAKYDKQGANILNKEEATLFKQRINRYNKSRRCQQSSSGERRNKMMRECMDFARARNRMFTIAAMQNNKQKQASYNQKQSFLKRQREIRDKRKAEKNTLCRW